MKDEPEKNSKFIRRINRQNGPQSEKAVLLNSTWHSTRKGWFAVYPKNDVHF